MKVSAQQYFAGLTRPLTEVALAIFAGLAISSVLMLIGRYNPLIAYVSLFRGAFGGVSEWASTLSYATPLMLTGVTFLVGLRAGLFNIGAEGQVYLGTLGAVSASLFTLPAGLHLLVALVFAMAVGAVWGLPAAILKATRGVHEVVSTIMLNWTAFWLTLYLVTGPLVDPQRSEKTISVAGTSRFPILVPGSELTAAIFLSVVFAVFVYFFLWHTSLGYEFRAVGFNPDAARYGGMSQLRVTILAFVLGGMAAGLAGATQVVGRPPTWALYGTLANVLQLGFNGLAVAMIGRSHPLGAIFAAIFFGGLYTGAREMQLIAGVPIEMVQAVQGIVIIAVAIPGLLEMTRQVQRKRRSAP